ncbi:MarR family transcriptional regulator [Deinococcus misasensis]|uniref:MarR family transcriptional regulator n=1 Tax=Deinococcus misasensis TaxID=392413 RepID=UPI0005506364|nr:helix-turn-helix domain-containing protein [Deinococcus misasensis]
MRAPKKSLHILHATNFTFQSVHDIAEATGHSPALVGRLASEMVIDGLLKRKIQYSPREVCFYRLTPKGYRHLQKHKQNP